MDKKLILDFDRRQKSLKHKRNSRHEGSKSKQAKVEATANGSSTDAATSTSTTLYRDRAKERREGVNKDFDLDPDDLKISNPTFGDSFSGSNVNALGSSRSLELDEAELRRQQIEESKYLGGDVEHTHLVKGLDFALLEKVKNNQQLAEKLASDSFGERDLLFGENSDSDEEEFTKQALLAASVTANSKRQLIDIEKLKKGKSTEIIPCRTALVRRILNVLDEKWPAKSELFLPGRMSYIIPIDEEAEDQSVTTVLRSKVDTSKLDEQEVLTESDLALEQLINILAKIRKAPSKRAREAIDLKTSLMDYE